MGSEPVFNLTQDSISQLNVVDNSGQSNLNNKFNSLLGIVNNASTALGKRYLREQLLNPINSTKVLKKVDISVLGNFNRELQIMIHLNLE